MKTLIAFIALTLAALLNVNSLASQPLKVVEDLRHELIVLPPSAPERSRLTALDSELFAGEDGSVGVLVYYDDSRTRWEVDYIEVYDIEGRLLLVGWVDRLGRCQAAMDRGLMDRNDPKIEGVLVMIAVGVEL